MSQARYDGIADHYDARFAVYASEDASAGQLRRLLGDGAGLCLDVGCGTGLHFAAVMATGRTVVGADLSSDQLRLAAGRVSAGAVVQADGTCLPFASESVPTAVSTFTHTDVDDIQPVFAEVRRVLQPGGRFVYLGLHPVFWGHFVRRLEDGSRLLSAGYMQTGWHFDSPNWGAESIRRKTGERHVTASELINAALEAGLTLERVEEVGGDPPPWLALVLRRPAIH